MEILTKIDSVESSGSGATVLYAHPYNLDAQGFYFHDANEFARKEV